MLTEEGIKQRIKRFICGSYKIPESELDETTNVFDGIIDSLSAAEVLAFLQKEFEVKFERKHLFDKRFFCIQGMAATIKEIKEGEGR